MSELKPCPFCGSSAQYNHECGAVDCDSCGAVGPSGIESQAVAAWNHRAVEADEAAKGRMNNEPQQGIGESRREPLLKLLEYADDSDGSQYGTLSTGLVRKLVNEALGGITKEQA